MKIQQGIQQGKLEGELRTVLRLLDRRFGPLRDERRTRLQALSLQQVADLADCLLGFATDADLTTWVQTLDDRLAQVRDRLRQQWPDLHRQAQQLGPHQLAALLETLPQLASPEALADWLQTQQPTE